MDVWSVGDLEVLEAKQPCPVRTHVDSGDSSAFVEAVGILKLALFKNDWSRLNRSFILTRRCSRPGHRVFRCRASGSASRLHRRRLHHIPHLFADRRLYFGHAGDSRLDVFYPHIRRHGGVDGEWKSFVDRGLGEQR